MLVVTLAGREVDAEAVDEDAGRLVEVTRVEVLARDDEVPVLVRVLDRVLTLEVVEAEGRVVSWASCRPVTEDNRRLTGREDLCHGRSHQAETEEDRLDLHGVSGS